MPVEVMTRRGRDTLCYGPLKPVGLKDPKTGREPFAVVQLRKDNAQGTIYNIVGFQTHLKWPEQKRVFSMIPALRNAGVCALWGDAPEYLPGFPGCWTAISGCGQSRASALPGRSPGWRAMWSPRPRLPGGPGAGPGAGGKEPHRLPRETAMGPWPLHQRPECGKLSTDERELWFDPPLGYRVKGKRNKMRSCPSGLWKPWDSWIWRNGRLRLPLGA